MRVRRRKNLKKKNAAITFLFLLPIIGLGSFAGVIVYMLYDMSSYTLVMEPPNTDDFYTLDEINDTILEQMAYHYDNEMETYHIPTNISVNAKYTDYNYEVVDSYEGTDNGALHIGYTTCASAMKHYTAVNEENEEDLENATRMVKKCVSAWSDMLAAPNGGIGPDYPGTPARFVCSFENKKYHPWMFEEDERHFNGTGDYSNWRVRLYTSRDELAGYYLGFASVLKFVDPDANEDSKWCVDRVKLLVEQMIEGFKKTNWLVLGGNGDPTGSDINSYLEGSTWQLCLLRIGATANPEKYDSLYHHVASKYLSMNNANMGSQTNTAESTYALSFGMDVMFALIILEDDPDLQYHYIENFETGFYSYLRYHRNCWYNIVHLAFMTLLDKDQREQFEDPDYTDDTIVWDLKDQLWRFYTSGWFEGIRNYNLTDRPHSTRSTSLNSEIKEKERVPTKKEWRDFFENNLFGSLFSWIQEEFDFSEESEQYLLPLTVSEYEIHHWMWEHSKFTGEGGNPDGDGLTEAAPNSYIVIYWMARAFDII